MTSVCTVNGEQADSMAQATKEPMLQADCVMAIKLKKKDYSVESKQERPRADLCDREWTVR